MQNDPSTGLGGAMLVRQFHRDLNDRNWTALESLTGEGYCHHTPAASGWTSASWNEFRSGAEHVHAAFPDWKNEIVQIVSQGERVAVLLMGSGTHKGSLGGEEPTGRSATLPIMVFHEIRDGKLIADWEITNLQPLMQSLSPNP
jgi:predicted ester cyclase